MSDSGPGAPTTIDAHMHIYRSRQEAERAKASYEIWEYGESEEVVFCPDLGLASDALAALHQAGADRAIVLNLLEVSNPGVEPAEDLVAYNRWLVELAAEHAEFVPFISVDPRFLSIGKLVAHVRTMVLDHGARGIKLHPPLQELDLGGSDLWPIFELCQDLEIAVVSHSGPSRADRGSGEPNAFRPLLERFPRLRISLAHIGGATWQQAASVAADFPHVYWDCSEAVEWLGAPHAPSEQEFVSAVRSIGMDRVMMGTDYPWYDIGHTMARIRALPGLDDAEQQMILGGNAAQFLT